MAIFCTLNMNLTVFTIINLKYPISALLNYLSKGTNICRRLALKYELKNIKNSRTLPLRKLWVNEIYKVGLKVMSHYAPYFLLVMYCIKRYIKTFRIKILTQI